MQPNSAAPAPVNNDPSQFGDYSDWAKNEMAKGFSADQLHQELAGNGVSDYGQGQSHPGAGGGNWFTHLLPTIGGVAGGALGTLTDVFDGPLGTIGGSAGGSSLGKMLENKLEGKQVLQGNDVTAGIEGGIGAGVGGLAAKGLGAASEFLGNTAGNIASREATQTAAQDAIDTAANTYKDIPLKLQQAYKAGDSLQHATNMGFDISDPENLIKLGNNSNDVLNEVLDRHLANSGPVDLSHYPQLIKDALSKESGTLGSFDKVALARGKLGYANTPATNLLQQLENLGNAPGEMTGSAIAKTSADPNEIRTLVTKLGNMAQDAKPGIAQATGAVDPQQRAIYNVINEVRGNVKDALYNRPELNDAIKAETGGLTPEDVGTQELADHLNGVITKAGQGGNGAQDLLDEISRNINIKNLGQAGKDVGQIVTSTGAKARAAADAGLGEAGATGNPVLDVAGHFVNPHTSLASKVVGGAAKAAQNPAILSTLSRIGGLGEKLAPAAGVAMATSPNLAADPVATGGMGPGAANGTMGAAMNNQNLNGAAGGTTDPNSMSSILSRMLYMGNVDPYLLSSTAPVVQSLAPQVQKQELAAHEIAGLPGSFANAGGAQGPGGILSRISGLIPGTPAHAYQGQQDAAAQALASAMGISPQAASSLLPQLMQNPQTAGMTQSILGNIYGQMAPASASY